MRQGQGEVTIVSWAMRMVGNLPDNGLFETKQAAINVVDIRSNCSKFDALFTSWNAVKKKKKCMCIERLQAHTRNLRQSVLIRRAFCLLTNLHYAEIAIFACNISIQRVGVS